MCVGFIFESSFLSLSPRPKDALECGGLTPPLQQESLRGPRPMPFTFCFLRAGGADGAIARGEAPQRGAQPRECRMPAKQAPRGAADSLPYILIKFNSDAPLGFSRSCASYSWGCALLRSASPQAIAPMAPPAHSGQLFHQRLRRYVCSCAAAGRFRSG